MSFLSSDSSLNHSRNTSLGAIFFGLSTELTMPKRQGISQKTRFEVFKRDSFTCQYCGRSAPDVILHLDHITPVSKDGDNDILNLITSCSDCNSGKSDRLLSDQSTLAKQKAQLDELNERREQLEMLLQWREGLKEIDNATIDAFEEEWRRVVKTYSLSDNGRRTIKKLIDKFGLPMVLDAIEKSAFYLKVDEDGKYTQESVEKAFNKIGGICRLSGQSDEMKEIYYIRGIVRNRLSYCNQWLVLKWLSDAYANGCDISELRSIALEARNWTQLKERLLEWTEDGDAES